MTKEQEDKFKAAIKAYDYEGLARVWQAMDVRWHAKEWKRFINDIRNQALLEASEVAKKMKQPIMDDIHIPFIPTNKVCDEISEAILDLRK